MKHVTVKGLKLEYRDYPATAEGRPTLLLLHEGLGSVVMWRHFPEKLAAATGCRLIVWSRAGYGGSEPYPEPRTPRYMHREGEEMLPALLAALNIERPILIGHSDGGSIALIFAGAFPEVPLGVAVMAPHEFVEAETLAGIRVARQVWDDTDWPHKLARYHRDAPRVFSDWNDCWLSPPFRDWNIEEYLPKIRCPVLAIQGEDDEYATMRQIEVIAEQVPGTELLKLPKCGHSPQRDQEALVLDALAAFVSRASGSCR
ncbi:alpha/beta fold hydrolase [Ferribacterium limneticum]|uniref:alpha/beta fold hydrolase n=1 Tax=Ferribacterium limneticum TaxID=76259 RepID=UPI001CFA5E59|nr:alpha/beta hydrolase [Ferribacterium limneticum]UCV29836.1 alpha/beta hydrolase [Ferribacterium limneticum]UCV33755.1 alpha/beta hydrolase [Ferribacterium limneticum]